MPYNVAEAIRARAFQALELWWEAKEEAVPDDAKRYLSYFLGAEMDRPTAETDGDDFERSARAAFCEAIFNTSRREIKGIVARRLFPPEFLAKKNSSKELSFRRPGNRGDGVIRIIV